MGLFCLKNPKYLSMKLQYLLSAFFLLFGGAGCDLFENDGFSATDKGTLKIAFDNVAGDKDLVMETGNYTNAAGETFNVTTLKYFVSNIKLTTEDGKVVAYPQESSYFLVDESDPTSLTLTLTDVPAGNYKALTYMIGVDSLRNTMDVSKRTGTLDIAGKAKGMYWSWNSGYIFFKMEGASPQAKPATDGTTNYRYHIGQYGGGFGTPPVKTINNLKNNTLAFDTDVLKIRKNKTPQVDVKMDVLKVFTGSYTMKLSEDPVIMVNPLGANVSANYAKAYTLKALQPNVP